MKISKVEIQAFRAYDELKDCTFDFTLPNGDTADFISLYAPNGFGKTSFYDAVEWGVTANIYRFIRQNNIKSYASDEKHLNYELANKKSPQFILRNKNSPSDRESFVRLHLLNQVNPKERILPKGRIDSTDYHFDEKITEEAKFRDVILSQDNIDAFLREDDPSERYEKFMRLFGDPELNRIYTNVLCLIKVNEHQIEQVEKEIKKTDTELPKDVDNQILEKINLRIGELIKQGENISPIMPNFTENDFLDFSNWIAERSVELLNELETTRGKLDLIREHQLRTDEYLLLKNKNAADTERLNNLQNLLVRFLELNKARNRMANVVISINQASAEHKEAEEVLRNFPIYLSATERIANQSEEIDGQKLKIIEADKELTVINNNLTAVHAEINRINEILFNLLQQQSDLPALEKSSVELTNDINQINEQAKILLADIDRNDKATIENSELQRNYGALIDLVNKNDYSAAISEDSEIKSRIALIKNIDNELKTLNADLKKTELDIANQTNLNNELKQLVVLSSAFVNKNNSDTCPVCLHEYDSFEELSARIINNPLLNDLLQQKLATKNNLDTTISQKVADISNLKKEILEILSRELATLKNTATRLSLQKNTLNGQRELIRNRLQNSEIKQRDIFVKINGDSIKEYSDSLVALIEQQQKSAKEKTESIAQLQKQIDNQKTFIESWRKTIQHIETGIRAYRLTEEFINVDQYLRKKGFLDYGNDRLEGLVAELQGKLDLNIAEEKLVSEQIRNLSEELKNHNEIRLNADVENIKDQLSQNNDIVKTFERFLTQYLSLDLLAIDGKVTELLKQTETETESSSKKLQLLIEEIEKIEGFKNNVTPLLKYMSGQEKIGQLSEQASFLKEKVNERLYKEKNRLASIIDEQIQSFFYEDLINQLYRKIDPHPNYKRIKFRCDFNDNKPKLNVFVTGSEDEYIIPNLYFSTAQTNILSLSIFLAKALNARDDNEEQINCIFIDDPIQSLDSINILSTIDLIRSLVVNFSKQIILSTHDENFYNLLQKKIPSGKFNSKFLELETFGKVKSPEN